MSINFVYGNWLLSFYNNCMINAKKYFYDQNDYDRVYGQLLTFQYPEYYTYIACNCRFIISCDRDEKIRVNSYPDTFNIISYCLGHEEFVSALGLLAKYPDILFSVSGDGTLRSWHYTTGEQLILVRLPHSATAMKLVDVDSGIHAIVSFHKVNQINVYNFTFNENNCMVCELLQCIDLCSVPAGFSVFGKSIWFSSYGYLLEYLYNPDKKKYEKSERMLCKELLDYIAITDRCEFDDFISSLFKKHYNNLEEYHKKKQMRMSKDLSVTAS